MKKILLFLLIISFSKSFSQYNETIRTGRPGQAIGAFSVGKNILQFQQGIDVYSFDNAEYKPFGIVSNNIIRFGIIEKIEISALIDYQYDQQKYDNETTFQSGLSNFHLGLRIHLNNQKGWVPATAFQMRLKFPKISKDYGSNNFAPIGVFVANWNLPKNMSIASNWILSYNGNDANPTGKYVLNFGFPIYQKLSGFIENYGQINNNIFQTRFDTGFAYLVNNNFQLDISSGFGNNQNVTDYFISTGISWRVLNFRK